MIRIPLTQGYEAIVDDEDAWVLAFSWSARKRGRSVYAGRNLCVPARRGAASYMHRDILWLTDPKVQCDHINGDGLDNRRANLRAVSQFENGRNKTGARVDTVSGYLGVSWDEPRKKWRANIVVNRRQVSLGRFDTAEEANAARLEAEERLWGVQPRRARAHNKGRSE